MLIQKIHARPILGYLGLLLHVPGAMALFSLLIAFIYHETHALIPFLVTGGISFVFGQVLYRTCYNPYSVALWDAMLIAALSWLLIPIIAAIPFYWIGNGSTLGDPISALFESFSGFTSTGLTMVKNPEAFSHSILWWRSFTEWVGGLGLAVFVISLTSPNRQSFKLYYSETRSDTIGENMTQTTQIIWFTYLILTLLGIGGFYFAGMDLWDAVNHALAGISTGGFSTRSTSFTYYPNAVKIVGMIVMFFGAVSLALHYHIFREGKWSLLWRSKQHVVLFFLLVSGGLIALLLDNDKVIDTLFEWVSALATCGFSSENLTIAPPQFLLLLMLGMFVGGAGGSTAGGIKTQRLRYLASGIFLRLRAITDEKVRASSEEEPSGIDLPRSEKTLRLYAAGVLLTLWTLSVLLGWFALLYWVPKGDALNALFDVFSAISNSGLGTGIMNPDFAWQGKLIFIILMWIGRLEIIPALILFVSFFLGSNKE